MQVQRMNTYTDKQGNIVCSIHMDASVMNKHDECNECLDDAHEAEILAR
jgi:hypothetical protein